MSKILKSTTLGNVKNGGIFKALGKEFVKLDADEHGCLVLAKDIWTKMPFRDGDDPECPNDLRRSDVMKYLGNCLAEFTEKGTPLDTFWKRGAGVMPDAEAERQARHRQG